MEEKILKFECALDRIIYPKYSKKVQSGDFAIFSMRIIKWIDNKIDEIETIKLKGTTCTLEYGTTYKVFCKLAETHEIYGDTYGLIYISKCIDISSKDKQKEFLKNVLNENLVEKLFDEYDDVIKLLENRDVKSLMKIKGIGNQVALRMIDEYEESKDYSSIYMELGQLGFTHTFIKKLVDFYKSPDTVIDIVKNNPYDLLRVDGIGFKKADEVACKVGITQYDIRRIKGFLLYYLNDRGEAGKSYLNYQELMKALYDTLGFVPEEIVNATAKQMIDNKDVVVLDNGSKIALKKFYDLEKNIMNELFRLQIGLVKVVENDSNKVDSILDSIHDDYVPKSFNIGNWETITEKVEEEQGFVFTDEQRAAIKLSLDNHVMTLTGGAGSGKTSTANGICSLYSGYSILACALSGKASVRITEATGLPASTIHRALGYQNGEFMFNKDNKLAVDIVLIDEATMINGTLFLSLLEAIPTGAKVIIMGDVQQLTPIGNCQVFADILDSNVLPVVKLSKPHRQALRSGIIPTSIKIANQQQIFDGDYTGNTVIGELKDMEFDISGKRNEESISDKIIKHFQIELEKFHDVMEVQVCVPMRLRGELSCYNLNSKIQSIYNPKLNDGNEIEIFLEKKKDETKKYTIRVGDKVINTKNNYKCLNSEGDQTPVFNGNMGIVKEIEKNGMCTIDFIGVGEVLFTKSDCKNLELGYACTTHKCQGSGFCSTIVGLDNSSYIMNNSELLYTAITRAKKYCILVANNYAVVKAIQTKEVKTKQTFLKDMLLENANRLKQKENGYMSSIYELTGEYLELMDMLEDEEVDEQTIIDTLEALDGEIENKADNYAKIIRSLESDIDGISKENDRLTARKKTYENRIKWLKQNLEMCMRTIGKKKFTTDLFSFNIQKNGGKRKLTIDVDVKNIPEEYRIKQPDAVDGEKLRDYLKENGLEGQDGSLNCEWCHLEPQRESLRIR